jgi:hypothetical protein
MAKKKTKNKNKDKILKEISEKLKEIQNEEAGEESEKSGLEEDIDLNTLSFSQFVPSLHLPEDAKIPVLERVASEQPRPVFVGTLPQASAEASGENSGKDDFKYVPPHENNEPKYTGSYAKISREPSPIDLMEVGRRTEIIPQADQEAFFMHSESSSQIEPPSSERMWAAERSDFERAGRENPVEAEKEKYKTYKPRLPKSY